MSKRASKSYQEAAVSWLPVTPYLSWPLLCLAALLAVGAVVRPQFFPTLDSKSVKPLALLVLSYMVIVYEFLGILVGQRRSTKLEGLLPQLLGPRYRHPPPTWDQHCLPEWRRTLPWEDRLRRVWRCGPILLVAAVGGAYGLAIGYTFVLTVTGNDSVAIALALWLALGGFWGAPANYHLLASSCFIWRLSRDADKTVFITPTTTGMKWVGRLAFEYLLLYSVAAILWTVIALIALGPSLATFLFAGIMSLFAFIGFALPQLSIRVALLRRKRHVLDRILTQIPSDDPILTAMSAGYVRRLMNLYGFVSALPPSGLFATVVISVATSFLPLFLLGLLRIAGAVFPHSPIIEALTEVLR